MPPILLFWLHKLIQPVRLPNWWADLTLMFPRFVCGFFLAKDFGADKFGMPWSPDHKMLGLFEVAYWFPQDVEGYGGVFAIFPVFFAWMGAFSEAIGGIFLALGLKTRLAAFLIMCTMLTAMFMQKGGQGLWPMLPAMGFLWVSLYSFVLGSGRFGLDHLIEPQLRPKSLAS